MKQTTHMKRDLFPAVERIIDIQKKSSHTIKKFALTLLIFSCFISTAYSGSLSTNDIVLLQFNSDGGGDELVFLPLVDLPAGEIIYFSDGSWNAIGSAFGSATERGIKFTVNGSGITAGTLIKLLNPTEVLYELEPSSLGSLEFYEVDGSVETGGSRELALTTIGDQILIFQTSDGVITSTITFIYGFNTRSATGYVDGWQADANALSSSLTDSHVPPGLTALNSSQSNKTTASALGISGLSGGHVDNWQYTGVFTDTTKDGWLNRVHTLSNWSSNDVSGYSHSVIASGSSSVVISGGSTPVGVSITANNSVSCNGGSDGSLTATATLGTANYTYVWSNGATTSNTSSLTNTISSLFAGTYTVTVADNNGTTATASATISQPSQLQATATSSNNVSCNGGSDGSASTSAQGGTSPYTYSWSNGATTASISNLAAGIYTTTVSDASGCTASASITITTPTSMTNSTSVSSNVSCNGGSDGSASISVAGGTPSYTYTWSNGETTATATSLSAGTYTVTATDANGCTITDNVSISQPTALGATSSSSNVTTNGGNNGSASASASGGTSPYTYAWSNGSTSSTATSLAAGTYTVSVTDNNGCGPVTTSETITQPAGINVSITSQTNVSCNGLADGSLTATASTGTSPYYYQWSSGDTLSTSGSSTISFKPAGTYTVTVTDNNGTTATASATISQPSQLQATATSSNNVSCNGGSDGSASTSAQGGTSPYTYSWSNGATSNPVTSLSAGTYTVTITDANGCTLTDVTSITEPAVLVASTTIDAIDTGGGTGAATVSATGGTPAYSYTWNNGGTTASVTNLAAGTYSVTITDANGCTDSASALIQAGPSISMTAQTNVSCNGFADGSLTATASSGSSPYFYQWSSGDTLSTSGSSTISFKPAGTYTVTVTDASGFTATTSASITEPSSLSATAPTSSNVSCNGGNDGSASIGGSGGTSPYTYSWSNGSTTASNTGLAAGIYTVTITDANGCTLTDVANIFQPSLLVSAIALDSNDMGNGGGATASSSGGTSPYTYLWSNGSTSASINGLMAGTYVTTITDNNGCTDTESIVITAGPIPTASVSSNVSCNGLSDGSASVNVVSGTMPFKYLWSSGDTSSFAFNLIAGTYTVTVTDGNMLTGIDSVTITQPNTLVAASVIDSNISCNSLLDGGSTASATGGTMPYTYAWSNSATTASITGVAAGTYSVTITDANGCTDSSSTSITEPAALVASSVVDSNVSCNGFTDGGSTASATGGTMPYTYTWSNAATTASITGVVAGTYSVTITDANGCSSNSNVSITEPATLVAASVVDSNITCNGFLDGGATASSTGGTGAYTYAWSNGATTSSITGVIAETYSVTVTDANSCTDSSSVVITEPAMLAAASVVDSNISCNGFLDGGATASATGGTMPYTYLWSNSAITASITGVAAGTYSVTITDANGCSSNSNVSITEPASLVAASVVDSNISCNGFLDGGATASATGGTMPYTYLWSNAATNASITGVAVGTYTVTITDNNSCTSTSSATITEPAVLVAASVVDSNATCLGFTDGGATASATGGTMPYTYLWSNAASTASITGVADGTYTITITDNNGCTSTSSSTIIVVDTVKPNVLIQNINVYLDASGAASITTADIDNGTTDACGAPALSLDISSFTCANVGANTVQLRATDVNGNVDSAAATVTVIDTIKPSVVTQNIDAYLDATGNATITTADIDNGTTDACGAPALSLDISSFTCSEVGANTVYLIATDVNGNVDSASAVVTVIDTIKPSVVTQNINAYLDASGNVSITTADIDNGSSNNCGAPALTLDISSFTCSEVGANTVYLIATDVNGNVDSTSAVVTVVDTVRPNVVSQNITIQLDASGNASIITGDIDNGTTDACNVVSLSLSKTSFTCSDVGANTVQLIATDVNGNVDSAAATVTVIDTIKPSVVTQNIDAYLDATGNATITTADIDNGTTDACGAPALSLDISSFTCSEVGANTVYLIATDVNGNVDSASAVVTVVDTVRPNVLTQAITIYLDASGAASITTADVDNGSSDACGTPTLSLSKSAFVCADAGANTIQLIATDVNGNVDSTSAVVTVVDTVRPNVVSQNITIQLDASGNASIITGDIDNGTTDACNVVSLSLSKTSFTCSDVGANTVQLIATDVNGNVDSAAATVTVIDTIKPSVVTQNIDAYLDATGNATITTADIDNGTTDACGAPALSLDISSFTCSEVGANTVYLIATDVNGNVDSASAVVTVVDTVRPNVLTQAITIYLDASGAASITTADVDNGSSDACGTPTLSLSKSAFVCADAGANTIQLIATDANSNVDSAAVVVTVLDTIKPLISNCLPNIFSTTDVTGCTTVINWTAPTAADNCNVDSLISSHNPGDVFPIGTTTVTYIAYDPSMNTDTCTFDIVVTDAFSPIITNMPVDITISNDAGNCDAVVTWTAPSASDNCTVDSSVSTAQSGDVFAVGSTMVYYTAYDPSMNTSVDSFMVTVNDTELPTITCPSDIAQCDSIITWTSPIGNDNCGVASTLRSDTMLFSSGDEFPIGTTTIEYQVTDIHNNQTTCDFDVTVFDPPIARAGVDLATRDIEPVRIASSETNAASVMWTPFDGLDDETAVSPLANPQVTTEYIMTVTSPDGCTDTDTMTIDVTVVQKLDVTTLFSPNGDGRNDTWVVNKPALIQGCRLIIVNRNGTEVYSTSNYNNEWDGTINGEELPEATYYYVFDCPDGRSFNGPITVIREKR